MAEAAGRSLSSLGSVACGRFGRAIDSRRSSSADRMSQSLDTYVADARYHHRTRTYR